ncbi:MAG: Glycosyltransferase [Candidatus Moranbacteria bacterium GW2011_GWF2_35_39]|nr:MAG: Glycosyltransferase [Candidatus Moranbacteria bacterium GW2011_GWF2_35_39]
MHRNLLIITQRVDEEDDLLGFFVDWIREFSKHFDKVFVITLARGKYDLPVNVKVHSLGKEKGNSKLSRLITFYYLLFTLLPKSSGIFAHMSPIFVIASWPIAFILRKKMIFWYLHRSVTLKLKLALLMCYKLVTAVIESLGIKSKKIIETGHGINIKRFRNIRDRIDTSLKIISVGRISPIKDYETIIKAVKIIKDSGLSPKLTIIGQPKMPKDFKYSNYLKKIVKDLDLGGNIVFTGFVKHNEIPEYYKSNNYFVGALPNGGIDKAMLEAMTSGCIAITSNQAFSRYLKDSSRLLIFKEKDGPNLADKILQIHRMPLDDKKELSRQMVNIVTDNHEVSKTIKNIVNQYGQ